MLSFITVNWRSAHAVREMWASLRAAVGPDGELIVYNNDPSEQDVLLSSARDSQFRVLGGEENIGFAAGCNRGAAAAQSDVLIFINPDTRVHALDPAAVDELRSRFGTRFVFGAVLWNDGRPARGSFRRLPTASRVLVDSLGFDRLVPPLAGAGLFYRNEADIPAFSPVEQPIGAFFGVGREAFDELGGFDERFFVYFEELDFALRAHWAGIPVINLPGTRIDHAGGHSTRSDHTVAIGLRWQSLRRFHAKHRGRLPLPPANLVIGIEAARFTLQRLLPGVGRPFSLRRALRLSRRFGM